MNILESNEELISFREAAAYVAGRYKGVEISTKGIFSWANSPKYAKNLETVTIGTLNYTSKEAVDRFIRLGKANQKSIIEDIKTIANTVMNNSE